MASSTLTVQDLADTDVVFTLAGSTSRGAKYKITSRSLGLPKELEFDYRVGNTGSKANDKLIVRFSDAVQDSETNKISVARVSMEVSVPRGNDGVTATVVKDLMAHLQSLLTDTNIGNVYGALVP